MPLNSSFLDITEVIVPRSAVAKMHAFLAEAGRAGLEGFTGWAGVQNGTKFNVTQAVIPRQKGHRTAHGLYVLIDSDELFLLNRWLYENQLTLIAQIHTHPTEAYHSSLDDEIPIATTQGCFSIVVPDFARDPFCLEECAVYRLSPDNSWDEVPTDRVVNLIRIVS
jgi:hypothetical protein